MRLQGKRALVTGAASGFGAGIAQRFAQEGARVACVDLDEPAAAALAATLPGGAIAIRADVADGEAVRAAVDRMLELTGGLDIVVNNAGVTQRPRRAARVPEAEIDRLFAVNVKSLHHMCVHAVPALREAGGGAIVNIASLAAIRPRPGMAWYNATKAAVISLTQSLAGELARDRIRVNAVAPLLGRTGMVATMFGDDAEGALERLAAEVPLGRLCEPADIAAACLYLASDDARFVTGVVLPVDGGRLVG
ncbi:MAG: SDR family oxidoreductase [Acidisphaera sp.]|nr:SDR family oxidoreductase [Acidisphaera sp.]